MVLLDTHAWMWWIDAPKLLSKAAARAIDEADRVAVSTISCLEVGMLVARGRVRLDRDLREWVRRALALRRIEAVSADVDIAVQASLLDRASFPTDPADQIIYATARAINATLITKDRRIREFDPRGTLW